jgi:hypothetical protein
MLPEWTTVGFSGHRKLKSPEIASEGIRRAFDHLAANHAPLAAISSAAAGGDTLFLEEVARRKLPFRLLLPFSKARFEQDFSNSDWKRVIPLFEKALIVEELGPTESNEEAYYEAGALTVERADAMFFLWNEKAATGIGGTGDMVQYARALERPLIIINPDSGDLSEERLDQLPLKSSANDGHEKPREKVEKLFKQLDEAANRHAPLARHLMIRIIFLHLLASAIGIITLGLLLAMASPRFFPHVNCLVSWLDLRLGTTNENLAWWVGNAASGLEVTILAVALFLVTRRRRWHHEWLHNRLGAELCRSFLATWNLRRDKALFPRMTINGFEKLARSLRIAWYLDKDASDDLEEVRNKYLTERVGAQIEYFTEKGSSARTAFNILRKTTKTVTTLAVACGVAAIALSFRENENWHMVAKLSSLLLPLLNAAFLSVVVSQEYSRRFIRYREMAENLRDIKRRLRAVKTWSSLFRVIMETEDCLLEEVIEWHSYVRFASEH